MLNFIFGSLTSKFIKKSKKQIDEILELETSYKNKTDEELLQTTQILKDRLKNGETLNDILPVAFATVREASFRTLGLKHYPVQLIGGISLHEGNIAQMRTGEGKTLVATLTAYLNALSGKGVHIVTVNDYLARRDTDWMGQVYNFLGLSVGVINGENKSYLYDPTHKELDSERDKLGSYKVFYEFLKPCSRKEAYDADITYGTNNEFGFDYLRDNICYEKKHIVQRGFNYSIIDEADSVLIDESRSPLIISSAANIPSSIYKTFTQIAKRMVEGEDYIVDEKVSAISIKETGIKKAEKMLGIENIYTDRTQNLVHSLNNALQAKSLKKKNRDYIVKEGQIVIVDVFTGRLMPGRQWSGGLHQAIASKEGLEIQQETKTCASITYQNYFRMYKKLCGMTGTAKSSEEEFYKVYNLQVHEIPTNKEVQREDEVDLIFINKDEKEKVIVEKIKELQRKGQPVLVGTTSIDNNEKLAKKLTKAKIKYSILNAKRHEQEGEIIAKAGEKGCVTVATNLAGRGVDIVLGGIPFDKEKYEEVCGLGGLFVLGTERHEARRIDDQLRGRSGRQGDLGKTQFYLSLEDDLVRVFGSDRIKNIIDRLNLPKDQAIKNKFISKSVENAQKKIEGFNFDARKYQLQYDSVLNKHRMDFYERRRKVLFSDDLVGEFENYVGKDIFDKFTELSEIEKLKSIILQSLDFIWREHLALMDHARSSVGLRAYGQKEPMMEYKNEAKNLYSSFYESVFNLANSEAEKKLSQ